jgi:hypothetical protein
LLKSAQGFKGYDRRSLYLLIRLIFYRFHLEEKLMECEQLPYIEMEPWRASSSKQTAGIIGSGLAAPS